MDELTRRRQQSRAARASLLKTFDELEQMHGGSVSADAIGHIHDVYPSYFCKSGHVVDEFEFWTSKNCPKCGRGIVSLCDCGKPYSLLRDYRPGRTAELSYGRDFCESCRKITPWAFSHLVSRSNSSTLSDYERNLVRLADDLAPERFGLSDSILLDRFPVRWYDRLLGTGLKISEPLHPSHAAYKRWNEAIDHCAREIIVFRQARQRQQEETERQRLLLETSWKELTGTQFEVQLMRHLKNVGFVVTHVGGPGDAGADLVINAVSGKIIVQCKAHSHPIGPGPVRDLFGSLQHHSAAAGWIVCLQGYSKGAKAFAKGKPIRLLTLTEILKMESLK